MQVLRGPGHARGGPGLANESVVRLVYRSPDACHLGICRRDTGRGLYLCPSLYPVRGPCLGPCLCRRRTATWEAFGCAWLATETAVKSGEKVLPSYAECPENTIYPDVPLRMLCVTFRPRVRGAVHGCS